MSTTPSSSARPEWGPRGDLDPAKVPIYPIVSTEIIGAGSIRVNGRTVPVSAGQTPAQAVVEAAAQEARRLPGEQPAIRVAVTMHGQRHRLVVTADKQVIPLDHSIDRPRWLAPLLAAITVSTVIVVGAAVYVTTVAKTPSQTPPTTAPAVLAPTGAGANFPVPAPPHFAQEATWSVPIDTAIAPVVVDEWILAVTDDHQLVLLDPVSGSPYWEAADFPSGVSDIHLTHLDGHMVAATATTTRLTYWPVPAPTRASAAGPATTPATVVDLPQRGTLVWAPTSPLIQLPDQTAGIIKAGQVITFDIPVGAQAVDVNGTTVLALDVAGHWWRVQPGQPFPPAGTLPIPKAGTGTIMRSVPVDTDHVLVIWPTAQARVVAGLVNLNTNQLTAQLPLTADIDTATPLATPLNASAGHRTVLGAVYADALTEHLGYLGGRFQAKTITGAHVYALDPAQHVVDLRVDLRTPAIDNSEDTTTAIPVGILGTGAGNLALVTADKVDQRLLYALAPSSSNTTTARSSPSPVPTAVARAETSDPADRQKTGRAPRSKAPGTQDHVAA